LPLLQFETTNEHELTQIGINFSHGFRGLRGFCFDSGVFNAFCIHRHKPPGEFISLAGLQPMPAVLSELASKPVSILLLDKDLHGLTLFLIIKFVVFKKNS